LAHTFQFRSARARGNSHHDRRPEGSLPAGLWARGKGHDFSRAETEPVTWPSVTLSPGERAGVRGEAIRGGTDKSVPFRDARGSSPEGIRLAPLYGTTEVVPFRGNPNWPRRPSLGTDKSVPFRETDQPAPFRDPRGSSPEEIRSTPLYGTTEVVPFHETKRSVRFRGWRRRRSLMSAKVPMLSGPEGRDSVAQGVSPGGSDAPPDSLPLPRDVGEGEKGGEGMLVNPSREAGPWAMFCRPCGGFSYEARTHG
jgi:hypothetical protein